MKKKILVIDDEKDILENIAEILELAGYEALTAPDGREGVSMAIREKPDAIVCDILMPELDGYGVIHLLHKNPETSGIPFIFLTAKTEKSDFRKGMNMGSDDYLTKPCDAVELLHAIELRLQKAAAQKTSGKPGNGEGKESSEYDIGNGGLEKYLTDHYDIREFPKKFVLYHEGVRPRYVYYLVRGKVKTIKVHPDGKEYITNMFGEKDFAGYSAVVEDINYDDTAIVLEEGSVIQIPREDFIKLLNKNISISNRFIKMATHESREKEERMLNLAYSSLRKRVANALIDLHKKFNPENKEGIILNITREDVARYVGTATESLIRTITDFRDERILEIDKDGKIFGVNLQKLNRLLN